MRKADIHLGYAVGTGEAVAVPLKHMVITGQTQEAGKTTALEALIARSGLRAVTFVTKRGEGSFREAHRVRPYFREQADWTFVASILEASRGEKLKFERAWIIRASRGAKTLADVQHNVREAMKTAKGMSADVYLTLDAYLDAVVPQIAAVQWAPAVELAAGINVMDLSDLNTEMQHLVIRSTLGWVLNKESNTVVVVPEAWKFIPQGRGTPVKLAAEEYIRQGAGLGNYLWLDSQDIAGVEKIILKSVPLWVLGVQREANEIKRTLDNIPAGIKKPKAQDVATLALGQFFACWGTHAVKVFVQPAWMLMGTARMVAMGELPLEQAMAERGAGRPREGGTERRKDHNEMGFAPNGMVGSNAVSGPALAAGRSVGIRKEDHMSKEDVEVLERSLGKKLDRLIEAMERFVDGRPAMPANGTPAAPAPGPAGLTDELWAAIRARALAEKPEILRVLTAAREIVVEETSKVTEVGDDTPKGKFARLIADGFLDEVRDAKTLFAELQRRGGSWAAPTVSNFARAFAASGFLTVEAGGYRKAPGVKVHKRHLEA